MRNVVLFVVIPNWLLIEKIVIKARESVHILCSTVKVRRASISPPVSLRYALPGRFNNRCVLKIR